MAKKYVSRRNKKEKLKQVDHIPRCYQQPRSRGSKRRTDFSIFSIPTKHHFSYRRKGSLIDFCGKDVLSTVTTFSLNVKKQKESISLEHPLVRRNKSQYKRDESIMNFIEVPTEVDSAQDTYSDPSCEGEYIRQKGGTLEVLKLTPDKSRVTERNNNVCRTPGTVVWAKTASQVWWPAEVTEERSTLADSCNRGTDGLVLVQFYGNRNSAWVDPARDVLLFEDCFEEMCCNPAKDFQDALKQALHQNEQLHTRRQLFNTLDEPSSSYQQEQSSDKWNSSSSSRTGGDYLERRRGMRERKPKVHFDEVAFPIKSSRKVRRLKIMRYLGLIAPVGSPFKNCFEAM